MPIMMPQRASVHLPPQLGGEKREVCGSKKKRFKKKLDRIADTVAIVGTVEETGENMVQVGKGIVESIQGSGASSLSPASSSVASSTSLFTKIFRITTLPFTFISGLVSAYFMGNDACALKNACVAKDAESIKEHSMSLVSNAGSVSGSTMSAGVGIYKLQAAFTSSTEVAKEATAQAAALSPAAAGASFGVFAVYSAIQAIAVQRIKRVISAVRGIFTSKTPEQKYQSDLDRYKKAMQDICERIYLTKNEDLKIKNKTKDFKYGPAYLKERERLLTKKRKKLERRIGKAATLEMGKKATRLSMLLESDELEVRAHAIRESEALFKKFKGALYKKLTVYSMRLGAGIVGAIGSAIAFFNPVGATIASGAFLSVSLAFLLASYFCEFKWKDRYFENGIHFKGRVLNNYEIPSAEQVIAQNERKEIETTQDLKVIQAIINKRQKEGRSVEFDLYRKAGEIIRKQGVSFVDLEARAKSLEAA